MEKAQHYTIYTVNTECSNCFTLLEHACLYILLGKVRTLLEWADEFLNNRWSVWMDG